VEAIILRFALRRGYERLGTLEVIGIDQPWIRCRFEPLPAFEGIRPLFDEELRLLEQQAKDQAWDHWEEAYSRIDALGLCIGALDGADDITDFILHIKDDKAWFRY
jgi:hypothetical protein